MDISRLFGGSPTSHDLDITTTAFVLAPRTPQRATLIGSNFRLADAITIMNGVCGALSIFSSLRFLSLTANLPFPPSREAYNVLYFAHSLPILGFGFDALDGTVARWMGGGSMLGQEMDSLADLISFGVAPAALAFTLGLRTPLDCLALLLFVSAGLARLARFNATVALIPSDGAGKSKYFEGLPIPSSLALTSMMIFWVYSGWFVGATRTSDLPLGIMQVSGVKGEWGQVHLVSGVFLAWAAMMVSKTLRVRRRFESLFCGSRASLSLLTCLGSQAMIPIQSCEDD